MKVHRQSLTVGSYGRKATRATLSSNGLTDMTKRKEDWYLTCSMQQVGQELISIANEDHQDSYKALDLFLDYLLKAFDTQRIMREGSNWILTMKEMHEGYFPLAVRWHIEVAKAMGNNDTTDFFGGIYEATFQGKGKASALGQFYTPEDLCKLMADVTYDGRDDGKVYDCCCGSGRTFLGHVGAQLRRNGGKLSKKARYIGEDIDYISCKMCALNLMVHGCMGYVVRHDSLMNDIPNVVYLVNELCHPIYTGVHSITTLTGDDARNFWKNRNGTY